ncbi:hypothetical protein DSL72_009383 [Monilinia vaccinii-corymbosi]|uniref:5'-3' DNA helicase ZGRF1-like N-terminal domain-containing protein n=1 Tax=Monilinia vaccinii-corymbosi TaxID=61207 RepID=A0A8A3PQY2_9HELO|nr:hypothetical protein DSL72_009383 [Monilinia vaccinii-corymbosi]
MSASASVAMRVPPDQNTAPVLEFRCLYTADIRRKQKRWQDGRLKYHTFNKRVMVFDERSNLVGDAHWRAKAALDEGAELELERSGIRVEVSEFLERTDQDLTELIDKRVKEREERFIARTGASTPARLAASVIRSQSIAAAHLTPRPLSSILGTPSGHYGKALIANTSPFEQRERLNASAADENESPRPTKRRKANEPPPSKSGFAQNLMGATLSFTPTASSTGPIRYEPLKLKSIQQSGFNSNNNKERGDDSRDASSSRKQNLVGDDMARDLASSKGRIPQRTRDKPEKIGYASNLTGASLSLSSFREATLKTMERNSIVQKSQLKTIDISSDTSSDEKSPPPAPISRPKDVARKNKKLRVDSSERTSRLSSPPAKATTVPKPAEGISSKSQESQNYVPSMDQAPQRSHSSLRIKSRPRNRMLMLLDQPSSRTPPLAMKQDTNRLTKLDTVVPSMRASSNSRFSPLVLEQDSEKSPKLDLVSPAAKLTLPHRPSMGDDGHDKAGNDAGDDASNDSGNGDQNDELQMSASPNHLNLSDFEEPASSPADVGINHQTIDAILSRTRPPEAQKTISNVASVLTEQRDSKSGQRLRSKNVEEVSRQPGFNHISSLNEKDPQIAQNCAPNHDSVLQTSPKHLPEVLGATERQSTDSVSPNKDVTLDRAAISSKPSKERPESNAHLLVDESGVRMVYDLTNKIDRPITESIITPHPAEKVGAAVRATASASASCAFQQTSVVTRATIHSNLAGKRNTNILPRNSDSIGSRAVVENGECAINTNGASSIVVESDKILEGLTSNGSTFNASGRFMAKLVPKPNQHRSEAVPIKTSSSIIDQPAMFLPTAQNYSTDVEIQQSPSSIPGILPAEQTRSDEISGFMSANQIIEKETQIRTSEAPNSGDQDLSRPRIINPATRGMSIQKTAKRTLHALAAAVNQMDPPAAIFGGPGSGRNTTSNTSATNVGDLGHETVGKGPWSRESFDLFGLWRPPVQPS